MIREIIGKAEVAIPWMVWGVHQHDNGVYGDYAFQDGYMDIIVMVRENLVRVITPIESSGIICHPRSGTLKELPYYESVSDGLSSSVVTRSTLGIAGGWKNGEELLTTEYIFPLIDEDKASFVIDEQGKGLWLKDESNYGNLYWTNNNIKDLRCFSWRGTPTRHFRLPSAIEIPGLSTLETRTAGAVEDTYSYTSFGYRVYCAGNIYAEAPAWNWANAEEIKQCQILSVCLNADNGAVHILTLSDHQKAPANVWICSDGTRVEGTEEPSKEVVFKKEVEPIGYFLTLWKEGSQIDNWDLVLEARYSRNGLPWFADESGSTFICINGDTFSIDNGLMYHPTVYGTAQESTATYGYTFAYNYNGSAYHEPVGSSTVILKAAASSTYKDTGAKDKDYSGEYPVKDKNITGDALGIRCIDVSATDSIYEIYGGVPPYTREEGVLNLYTYAFEWYSMGEDDPMVCGGISQCPIGYYYRYKDMCSEFIRVDGSKVPVGVTAITVSGPAVWTGSFSDYSASGGTTGGYVWQGPYPECSQHAEIRALQCWNGTGYNYVGIMSVKVGGTWVPGAKQESGDYAACQYNRMETFEIDGEIYQVYTNSGFCTPPTPSGRSMSEIIAEKSSSYTYTHKCFAQNGFIDCNGPTYTETIVHTWVCS